MRPAGGPKGWLRAHINKIVGASHANRVSSAQSKGEADTGDEPVPTRKGKSTPDDFFASEFDTKAHYETYKSYCRKMNEARSQGDTKAEEHWHGLLEDIDKRHGYGRS